MELNGNKEEQSLRDVGNNKRKRKAQHSEDVDTPNQRPGKRLRSSSITTIATNTLITAGTESTLATESTSTTTTTTTTTTIIANTENEYTSESTKSSSICYSNVDFGDLCPLGSPQSLNNILSPLETSPKTTSTWIGKGDSTPHSNNKKYTECYSTLPCCVTSTSDLRLCPLPALSWAEAKDVWKCMCRKDEKASLERDSSMLCNHPGLQPRMRAILLDWLIEVCEVYKLHRETYYLAVDYLDRFLSSNVKVSKTRLQLIGITCLFIAAKVEEIYPPKIGEFAYVTDGACQEDDIIQQELILLTALNWCISPVTIIGWLSVYMQLHVSNRTPKSFNNLETKNPDDKQLPSDAFIYPQFSSMEFAQAAQLIDLCTLDLGLANYPYSVIAAAAISHTFNKTTAIRVSGLDWSLINPCAKWMKPFFEVIREEYSQVFLLEQNEQVKTSFGLNHICPNIISDDSHIIQTHTTSLTMFDKAMLLKEKLETEALVIKQEASPAQPVDHSCSHGLLTPPASNRKFLDNYKTEQESDIKNTKTSY